MNEPVEDDGCHTPTNADQDSQGEKGDGLRSQRLTQTLAKNPYEISMQVQDAFLSSARKGIQPRRILMIMGASARGG